MLPKHSGTGAMLSSPLQDGPVYAWLYAEELVVGDGVLVSCSTRLQYFLG